MQVPLHRLREFISPTAVELAAFEKMRRNRRKIARQHAIRSQMEPVDEVYFLLEGWVASCVDVADGGRQIVKIHLPGDLLGVASMSLTHAAETLLAVTPVTVDVVPLQGFGHLFMHCPRLAAAVFLSTQQERVILMDKLTSVGRTGSAQRVAAFLLHIHERLKLMDPALRASFDLPLTQAQLAEVVGVTTVHLNRTLRDLDRSGMIERTGHRITLADLKGLRELAGMPVRRFVREPAWVTSIGEQPESLCA